MHFSGVLNEFGTAGSVAGSTYPWHSGTLIGPSGNVWSDAPALGIVSRYGVSPLRLPIAAGSLAAAPGFIRGPVVGTPGTALVNAVSLSPFGSPVAQEFPSAIYTWGGVLPPQRSSLTHSLGASWS